MKKLNVIVFDSTHQALAAENCLVDEKIIVKMIPTPREITLSCGLAIKFDEENMGKVKDTIINKKLIIKGVYCIDTDKKNIEQIM
jgi:hypothetical protein